MNVAPRSEAGGYDAIYDRFDSPLMRRLRSEAYGEDIAQHSWVTADELRLDLADLRLSRESHLLDLGCGPCGPLTFLVALARCRGTGLDASGAAIRAGHARAASLGLGDLVTLQCCDLNEPLPLASGAFDAVVSLDVVLHLRDRAALFLEVARVLRPRGRFLFTDAGVVTGPVSDEEVHIRATHGHTVLVPGGYNERTLEQAGFRLIRAGDRTPSVLKNAGGRLAASMAHRAEIERLEGSVAFESERLYLETVIALARRGALSRMAYLAEFVGT